MAYFYIEIEDGAPISFQVVADFTGPLVRCHQPIVDFGLVKVNSQDFYEIEIENTSPVPAEVLIKNAKNERLNFSNMMTTEVAAEEARRLRKDPSSSASLVFDRPLMTKNKNKITLEQTYLILKPRQRVTVAICLESRTPETVQEHLELLVKDGASQYFQMLAEI